MEIIDKRYVDEKKGEAVQVIWLIGESQTICTCFHIPKKHPGQQRSIVGTCLRDPNDAMDKDYAMRLSLKRALRISDLEYMPVETAEAHRKMYSAFRHYQWSVQKGVVKNETTVF